MSRKNTPSLAQVLALLKLAEDLNVTQTQLTEALSSGVLADIFNAEANLRDRYAVRTALELPNYTMSSVKRVTIDQSSVQELPIPNYANHWPCEKMLAKRNKEQVPFCMGTYECMCLKPALKTCTLETLQHLTAALREHGKWQPANEAHLTACMRAYYSQEWMPELVLASGATSLQTPYETYRPRFGKGYGMCGWSYGVCDVDTAGCLQGMSVLYVRKVA